MKEVFLVVLALVWIIFASIQDIRKREVANWLNFSLIIFALGFRFFYSIFNYDIDGFNFFIQGLAGFGIFFVLGNFFYYSRIFAGGDAKLMMALGAILPFSDSFAMNLKIFAIFLFIFLFVGAVYGLMWSFVLALKNPRGFKREFVKIFKSYKKRICVVMLVGLIIMILGFYEILLLFTGILIFITPYLFIYAKAIEESCMIQKVNLNKLREGDWLYKDLKLGKTEIKSKWEGLTKKDIRYIKQKYKGKSVEIKQGVPFVPVFLISFVLLIWLFLNNFYLIF